MALMPSTIEPPETRLAKTSSTAGAASTRAWPVLRSFAGWRWTDIGRDVVAGLTLAAIAIPSQMATARLAGFAPQAGFLALIAGAVGFALFGANRWLLVGADSTIAPIFAGALTLLAASGTPDYERSRRRWGRGRSSSSSKRTRSWKSTIRAAKFSAI